MINRKRVGAVTGGLLLLWTAVSAQDQTPPAPAPVVPGTVQPGLGGPETVQPAAVSPGTVQPSQTLAPAVLAPTAPAVGNLLYPVAPQPPALGSELRGKLKADEQHFGEKSAAAKREFDLRQAEEKKEFEATLAGKGFLERRRLTKEFRAAQAQRYREFNAEQETKRRTYEWRFP